METPYASIERRIWLLVLSPYVLIGPVAANYVIDLYRGRAFAWVSMPAALVGIVAFLGLGPLANLMLSIGSLAYAGSTNPEHRATIDWRTPQWARAGDALREFGVEAGALPAYRVFGFRGNVSVAYSPQRLPGTWQRMLDYSLKYEKWIFVSSVAPAVVLFTVLDKRASWIETSTFYTIFAVFLALALPYGVTTAVRQYRVNVKNANMAIVVPQQWKRLIPESREYSAIFAHEWHHVRHRDAFKRRFLHGCSNPTWFMVFMTTGGAVGAFNDYTDVVVIPGLLLVPVNIMMMRTWKRLIPLVQELRADASVGDLTTMGAALANLPVMIDDTELSLRRNALTAEGSAAMVRRLRRQIFLGWFGYVVPVYLASLGGIFLRMTA